MAASIDEQTLSAQAFGYARCAVDSNALAIDDSLYGECGCEDDCRAMFYQWGVEIMNTTDAEDCDCNDKCVTAEFACATIRLLNPGCITCGCGSPDDVPETCDISYTYTVFNVADAAFELSLLFMVGTPILISGNVTGASNEWSLHVGQIAISNGTSYTYIILPLGSVVLSLDAPFVLGDFNTDFNTDFNI